MLFVNNLLLKYKISIRYGHMKFVADNLKDSHRRQVCNYLVQNNISYTFKYAYDLPQCHISHASVQWFVAYRPKKK
jgi:hypothetical protein